MIRTRVFLTAIGVAALFLMFHLLRPKQSSAAPRKEITFVPKVVAYVPNWIDMDAFARTIEYSKLTHINIAFENPVDDAGNMSFNPKNKILIDRAHANRVPVLISIGGGGAASDKTLLDRYALLLGDAKRAQFIARLAAFVSQHNFDGLDVDIDGSTINKDYGSFIADLARALRSKGKLLTAALAQGNGGDRVPDSVFNHFDWINIMSYDAVGPWRLQEPGQHSSLAFAKSTVEYWTNRGLPKHKAVMGVPFYGYGFGEAFLANGYTYAAIVDAHPGAENKDQVGNTIWYNGIPTIKAKVQYMRERELGGIMIWSLNSDARGKRSLLSAIHEELKQTKPKTPAIR
jgi:GH18 family chitinase